MSDRSERHEALEKIQVNITSLTEERGQLQKRVEELENDNIELKKHLEENAERVRNPQVPISFLLSSIENVYTDVNR